MSTDVVANRPPFDLSRDFDSAWANWNKKEGSLERRTIADLGELLRRFEERARLECGPAATERWPVLSLHECDIERCSLRWQSFTLAMAITNCRFLQKVDLAAAKFSGGLCVAISQFLEVAEFTETLFVREPMFSGSVFEKEAAFKFARFERGASFHYTAFNAGATFLQAHFTGAATMSGTRFKAAVNLVQTRLAESLDLRTAIFEADSAGLPVSLNIKSLRVGGGTLAGGLLLSREQLERIKIAGEDDDHHEELQSAIQQYGDLVGNFRAMSGPENYEAEDYCRLKCRKLEHRLRRQSPASWWRRTVWAAEWNVIHHGLGDFLKPQRIFLLMLLVIAGCAVLYAGITAPWLDLPLRCSDGSRIAHWDFRTALYFSTITFSTVGYGDWRPEGAARFLAAGEGLSGILLTASFIVALSRRYIR